MHPLRLCVFALLLAACNNDGGFVASDGSAQDAVVDAPESVDTRPAVGDAADAAAMCVTPNPAELCPTAASKCVPSSCACYHGLWICTDDCGGGRNCGDAGTDTL